ncbi:MAG: rRNA maturation RNase YbeY [Patescibacteria group bacterium]
MKKKSPSWSHILKTACERTGLKPDEVEVGVYIVSPEKMRELNKKHRGKDKSTDVLSFPIRIKHDILYLGDIFVNKEEPPSRLPFLVVHGFLHLVGYDHERSKKDEKVMFSMQNEILDHLRD